MRGFDVEIPGRTDDAIVAPSNNGENKLVTTVTDALRPVEPAIEIGAAEIHRHVIEEGCIVLGCRAQTLAVGLVHRLQPDKSVLQNDRLDFHWGSVSKSGP